MLFNPKKLSQVAEFRRTTLFMSWDAKIPQKTEIVITWKQWWKRKTCLVGKVNYKRNSSYEYVVIYDDEQLEFIKQLEDHMAKEFREYDLPKPKKEKLLK